MGFCMLPGRETLRGRFVVDPGKSHFGERSPRSKERQQAAWMSLQIAEFTIKNERDVA
jgi:hypothetical protein